MPLHASLNTVIAWRSRAQAGGQLSAWKPSPPVCAAGSRPSSISGHPAANWHQYRDGWHSPTGPFPSYRCWVHALCGASPPPLRAASAGMCSAGLRVMPASLASGVSGGAAALPPPLPPRAPLSSRLWPSSWINANQRSCHALFSCRSRSEHPMVAAACHCQLGSSAAAGRSLRRTGASPPALLLPPRPRQQRRAAPAQAAADPQELLTLASSVAAGWPAAVAGATAAWPAPLASAATILATGAALRPGLRKAGPAGSLVGPPASYSQARRSSGPPAFAPTASPAAWAHRSPRTTTSPQTTRHVYTHTHTHTRSHAPAAFFPRPADLADVAAMQPTAWGAARLGALYYFFLARPSPVVGGRGSEGEAGWLLLWAGAWLAGWLSAWGGCAREAGWEVSWDGLARGLWTSVNRVPPPLHATARSGAAAPWPCPLRTLPAPACCRPTPPAPPHFHTRTHAHTHDHTHIRSHRLQACWTFICSTP